MTTERFFCTQAARRRCDPLPGSAPRGVVWVLIEYRGAWPENGFEGLDLDPAVKGRVFAAAQAVRARILLIRRPGRRRSSGPDRWAVVRYDPAGAHRQYWGEWCQDADLDAITEAIAGRGEKGHPPVLLVCTHGRHDTCCALWGRPVAQALSDSWPELVWECTHVGGDRFAATVVVVPDGVYYGGLDADSARVTITEHLADRIWPEKLRGYTDLAPAQQVAIAATLDSFGPAGRHAYRIEQTLRDGDRWQVRVASTEQARPLSVDVDLQARRSPDHQLTCRGPARSSATYYDVVSIHPVLTALS